MVLEGARCELYEASQPGEEAARIRVLTELGPYAVLPKPNPRIEPHEKKELHMATNVKKPTLRSLGVAAGIYKQGDMKVFQKELPDLLDDLKKDFPGIEDMDENAVQDLLADVKKNGVTGGKGGGKDEAPARGRGRSAEKEEEPPARGRGRSADKEEKSEEPPARGRGRGRAAEKDEGKGEEPPARGRGRGRAAEEEKDTSTDKGSSDNTQVVQLLEGILGKIDDLGERIGKLEGQGAENAEAIGELSGQVAVLRDGIECIVFGDEPEKGEKTLEDVIKRVQG